MDSTDLHYLHTAQDNQTELVLVTYVGLRDGHTHTERVTVHLRDVLQAYGLLVPSPFTPA